VKQDGSRKGAKLAKILRKKKGKRKDLLAMETRKSMGNLITVWYWFNHHFGSTGPAWPVAGISKESRK